MGVSNFCFLLLCGVLSGAIGSELYPSSILSIQDSITALKQKVQQLDDSITSIPQTLQEANEDILLTVLEEIAKKLKNYASTNKVSEMGEALRKELQMLLSNHSLRVDQSLRNQTLQINRLSRQIKDIQNSCVGEPPSLQNGKPIDFERKHGSSVSYHCNRNFAMTGNSTVRCNSGKWEGHPPVCRFFDTTFTLRAHFGESPVIYYVSCSSGRYSQKMEFSRFPGTRLIGTLPKDAKTYLRGKDTVLDLSSVERPERPGAYQCGYETDETSTGMSFLINSIGYFSRPQVASIGDTVELGPRFRDNPSLRWLRDGERIPAGDGRGTLTIAGVRADDAGVYERYRDINRRGSQVFFKLVVRGCQSDVTGGRCNQVCPPCYNGGVCHDLLGVCICPPGFEGSSCEVACGKNRYGLNCSESCDAEGCNQVLCMPDPYGCSCASGYHGSMCSESCKEGEFGADCKQICHCSEGPCDPYTGACSGGCSPGWTGHSCQIPAGN